MAGCTHTTGRATSTSNLLFVPPTLFFARDQEPCNPDLLVKRVLVSPSDLIQSDPSVRIRSKINGPVH